MGRKIVLRFLLGFPMGVFISYTITFLVSLLLGHGVYYPAVPALVTLMGGEMAAVSFQYMLSGILGGIYGAASLLWGVERWSYVHKSLIHFTILSLTMFPIAYVTHWMPHTLGGILQYIGIFVALYLISWAITYQVRKREVDEVNSRLGR